MSQVCLRSGHKWLWHSPDVIVCESTVTAALKEASVKWHASYRQLTLSFGCIQYCFLVLFEARQKLLHVSWTVISWKYLVKSSVQTAEQLVFDIFLVYFLNRFLNWVILAVIWTECHGTFVLILLSVSLFAVVAVTGGGCTPVWISLLNWHASAPQHNDMSWTGVPHSDWEDSQLWTCRLSTCLELGEIVF